MIIYILNDENTDKVLKVLESIHCGRGIEQDIYIFYDVDELLENCVTNTVHVVILNEKIGGSSGYELAYHLRMIDKNILPIIIRHETAMDEKAGEAELFGCIIRDNMDSKLPNLIGYAAKRIQPDSCLLTYFWNNQEKTIDLDGILYFCSRHRVVEIIGDNGTKGVFYKKLDELEEELKGQHIDFVRVNKSVLLNPRYILERSGHEILLTNGEKLLVSRKYSKDIKI